jgi:hypothetical protein
LFENNNLFSEFDIVSDQNGKIILVSSNFESIFGYRSSESINSTLDIIIPENLREKHWEGYRRVFDTGFSKYENKEMKTKALTKGKSIIYIYMAIRVIKQGNKVDFIGANFRRG